MASVGGVTVAVRFSNHRAAESLRRAIEALEEGSLIEGTEPHRAALADLKYAREKITVVESDATPHG